LLLILAAAAGRATDFLAARVAWPADELIGKLGINGYSRLAYASQE
jgi:hypothetical protein